MHDKVRTRKCLLYTIASTWPHKDHQIHVHQRLIQKLDAVAPFSSYRESSMVKTLWNSHHACSNPLHLPLALFITVCMWHTQMSHDRRAASAEPRNGPIVFRLFFVRGSIYHLGTRPLEPSITKTHVHAYTTKLSSQAKT